MGDISLDASAVKRVNGRAASCFTVDSLSNGFYRYTVQILTSTNGCNYSLCTPDDGSGRRPKHLE